VLANAKARGEQLRQRLAGLEDRHSLATGERGIGLLRGLELGADVAGDVVTGARERGLLVNPVRPSVVRFMPPLTVTEAEIDEAVDIVESVLDELESR
jgi:acetylornithine/succinyldiaminopimelate/putrescine aminotransferase